MRALVTGATGFVGKRLLAALGGGVVLSRDPDRARADLGAEAFAWQPEQAPPPAAAFEDVGAVFHLCGEPVAGRWTSAKKARIRASRVEGTRHLVAALAALPPTRRPEVLVSASGVGIYGDRGDERLDEGSAAGTGFLADVCRAWESAAMEAEKLGIRVVRARIGVVLGDGGALAQMRGPFSLGLGGRLGDGRQYLPWIHVDDVARLLRHAASQLALRGPLNVVGPEAATNREFTRALGKALRRPAILPVPGLALRLVLGELAGEALASLRVVPRVALESGFAFEHTRLDEALRSALARP